MFYYNTVLNEVFYVYINMKWILNVFYESVSDFFLEFNETKPHFPSQIQLIIFYCVHITDGDQYWTNTTTD